MPAPLPAPRVSILSMMKDEGPRLLEWLAYHRLIGAAEVFVYTNDCRDGTDAMLDRLEAMGLVRHLRNAVPEGRKPQPHALSLAEKRAEITEADWLMVIDADEFVHVKTGDGSFAALLAACAEGTEGVAITWRMMGSSGAVTWSDGPLLPQFTRGAPDEFRRGRGGEDAFPPLPASETWYSPALSEGRGARSGTDGGAAGDALGQWLGAADAALLPARRMARVGGDGGP